MKHALLWRASLLVFAGTLAGCGIGVNSTTSSGGHALDGESLTDLVAANAQSPVSNLSSTFITQKNASSWSTTDGTVVSANYASKGLLVTTNSAGNLGFYSLAYQKYLVAPCYVPAWLNYQIQSDDNVGFFLFTHYEGKTRVIDSLGNVILDQEDETFDGTFPTVVSSLIDKNVYLTLKSSQFFSYQADGSLKSISKLPEATPTSTTVFNSGDFFADPRTVLDLKDYGYEGYTITVSGSYTTVFDSNHNAVSSFILPTNASSAGLIGNILFYQYTTQLPADAVNYTFSEGANKYTLTSGGIDIMTGKATTLALPYVIQSLASYKDTAGKYVLGVATLKKIDANKALDPVSQYLMDKEGKLYDDVTGLDPNSFVKLDTDHYFNTTNSVIFNAELKPIAYLTGMNAALLSDAQCFYGSYNGKYGTVDYNGRVLIPFEYDTLIGRFDQGKTLGVKGGQLYRIAQGGTATLLGMNFTTLAPGLYSYKDGTDTVLCGLAKDYATYSSNYQFSGLTSYSSAVGSAYYAFLAAYDSTGNTGEYLSFSANPYPNNASFSTLGDEVTDVQNDGRTLSAPIELHANQDQTIVITKSSGAYCSFLAAADSLYTFELSGCAIMQVNASGNVISGNNDSYTFSATANQVVYFQVVATNATFYPYALAGKIYPEDGRNPAHPLQIDLGTGTGVFHSEKGLYLNYACLASGAYTLSASGCQIDVESLAANHQDALTVNLTFMSSYMFHLVPLNYTSGATVSFTLSADASLLVLGSSFLNPYPLTKRVAQSHDVAVGTSLCFSFNSDDDSPYTFKTTQSGNAELSLTGYVRENGSLSEVNSSSGTTTSLTLANLTCPLGATLFIEASGNAAASGVSFLLTGNGEGKTPSAPLEFALGTSTLAAASFLRYVCFTAPSASHYLFSVENSSSFNLIIRSTGTGNNLYSSSLAAHYYEADLAANGTLYFLLPATANGFTLTAQDLKAGTPLTLDTTANFAIASSSRIACFAFTPTRSGIYPVDVASFTGAFRVYDANGAILSDNIVSTSYSSRFSLSSGATYYFSFYGTSNFNGTLLVSSPNAVAGALSLGADQAASLDANADTLYTYHADDAAGIAMAGTGLTSVTLKVIDTTSGATISVTTSGTNAWTFTVSGGHDYVFVFTNANAATSGTLSLTATLMLPLGTTSSLALEANVAKSYLVVSEKAAMYHFVTAFSAEVSVTLSQGSTTVFTQSGSALDIHQALKANTSFTITLTSATAQSGTLLADYITLTGAASLNVTVGANQIYAVRFVPSVSGTLTFTSNTSGDTYGILYDANLSLLMSNDDGGSNNNFKITYSVTAGTVYFLGARFYSQTTSGTIAITTSLS